MKKTLTRDIAYKILKSFFKEKPLVLFGTGISCAMDVDFGMSGLCEQLRDKVPNCLTSQKEKDEWKTVESQLTRDTIGLETALNSVQEQSLVSKITKITGEFVATLDRKYSSKISKRERCWPAGTLFKRLVEGLPETDRMLHVITPNYDMLMEYECDAMGIKYINGFVGGVRRNLDWDLSTKQVQYSERTPRGKKVLSMQKYYKHIRFHKVHGSLNLFQCDTEVVENNSWMWEPPDFAERVIVTPGISKFEKITSFRQELLEQADKAIKKENVFLFIGYGFNDKDIETYINPKLINHSCLGLIITRDSNEHIEDLMQQAKNLWLVCKEGDGTTIRNSDYDNILELPNKQIWNIADFTHEILGD